MVAKTEQVVEVPTHAFGRHHSRRDDRVRRHDCSRGQELHLEIVRKLHLGEEPLLSQRRADQSRVLNRRTDLRGDRGDELLITSREWLRRMTVREIHHTKGLAATRRRPHDRYRKHRAAPIRRFRFALHLIGFDEQRMLGTKNPCAYTARVLNGNHRRRRRVGAECGDDPQRVR